MFGRERNIQHNFDRKPINIEGNKCKDLVDGFIDNLHDAWNIVTDQQQKRKKIDTTINIQLINGGRKTRCFEYKMYQVGDYFFRKRHPVRVFKSIGEKEANIISSKLQSRWEGPFIITKRLNAITYEYEDNKIRIRVNAINMKPAYLYQPNI
jgi:hypothetical protein